MSKPGADALPGPGYGWRPPDCAQGLLHGLSKATKEETSFPWSPVLDLCRNIVDKSAPEAANSDERSRGDHGASWSGLRKDIANLLGDALRQETIPADADGDVFGILAELAADPDPSSEVEQRRAAAGETWPATLDLNSVRGTAFHAVMQYAWWRKKRTPAGEMPQLTEGLQDLLDRHLNPDHEQTEAIRSIYGRYLPYLMACDEEWTRSRVPVIFPGDPSLERLRQAAWEGYILVNRPYRSVYELLVEHYDIAVTRLGQDDTATDDATGRADELRDALLEHILSLYVQGVISLEPDGLVSRLFTHAPVSTRARFIELVGFDLRNKPTLQELARLQGLWEWRLALLEQREQADLDELAGFGWWFASDHLDSEWALTQLHNLLTAGGTIDADHPVIERLATLRHQHLHKVVACLGLVIEAAQQQVPQKPWFVAANRDELTGILEDGTKADDPSTARLALEIVNRLIARGYTEFQDLLPPTPNHAT